VSSQRRAEGAVPRRKTQFAPLRGAGGISRLQSVKQALRTLTALPKISTIPLRQKEGIRFRDKGSFSCG
jgi:hypothetical protein